MTELQLGLLAIGTAVVVAVIAYNKWQELQYRKRAESGFRSSREDVLLQPGNSARTAAGSPGRAEGERIEPVLESFRRDDRRAGEPRLADALDYIVTLEAADGLAGDAILAATDVALARCSKAVLWEGYNDGGGAWEPLRADLGYSAVRAGLQLVDRRGVASAEEVASFGAAMQEAAAALGASVSVPDAGVALARAADLDRFCAEVDIQIALNLLSAGAPFSGSRIRSLVEAAGLALEADGKYRRRDQAGRQIYELGNLDPAPFAADTIADSTTPGLTAEFDVPRAPGGESAFGEFGDFTRRLAQSLGASIVDDNRKLVGAAAFDAIRSQLRAVYRSMEARGIAAGGPLALRLFS